MYSFADKVFNDHIPFVAMREGVSGPRKQVVCLLECQFQCDCQSNSGILGRLVVPIRHNFGKQTPIHLRSFINTRVSPSISIDVTSHQVYKSQIQTVVQLTCQSAQAGAGCTLTQKHFHRRRCKSVTRIRDIINAIAVTIPHSIPITIFDIRFLGGISLSAFCLLWCFR